MGSYPQNGHSTATRTTPVVELVLVSVALIIRWGWDSAFLPTERLDLAMEKLAEADVDMLSPLAPSPKQLSSIVTSSRTAVVVEPILLPAALTNKPELEIAWPGV